MSLKNMSFHGCALGGRIRTVGAFVRLFACMCPDVALEVTHLLES